MIYLLCHGAVHDLKMKAHHHQATDPLLLPEESFRPPSLSRKPLSAGANGVPLVLASSLSASMSSFAASSSRPAWTEGTG